MTPADDVAARREIEPMDDGAGGYRLAGWDEKGPVAPPTPPGGAGETPASQDESAAPRAQRQSLPPRPFLTGTFSFPFSAGAWFRTLLLAAAALVVLLPAAKSLGFVASQEVVSWIFCLLLGAMSGILAVIWFTFASACALAVVRDTANRLNKVSSWPGFDFLVYLFDPLYLINSLCISVLPGVVLGSLLARFGLPRGIAASASVWLLFPIVLLSMLENGSPLDAVSGAVWRTFAVAGRGWTAFYLTSATLLPIGGAAAAIGLWLGGLPGTIVAAAALAFVWLVYFRLLGRLAWYCADRTADDEPDAEAEAEAAAEMEVQGREMVPVTFVFCPRCGKRVEIDRLPVGAEVACGGCGLTFAVECKSPS